MRIYLREVYLVTSASGLSLLLDSVPSRCKSNGKKNQNTTAIIRRLINGHVVSIHSKRPEDSWTTQTFWRGIPVLSMLIFSLLTRLKTSAHSSGVSYHKRLVSRRRSILQATTISASTRGLVRRFANFFLSEGRSKCYLDLFDSPSRYTILRTKFPLESRCAKLRIGPLSIQVVSYEGYATRMLLISGEEKHGCCLLVTDLPSKGSREFSSHKGSLTFSKDALALTIPQLNLS